MPWQARVAVGPAAVRAVFEAFGGAAVTALAAAVQREGERVMDAAKLRIRTSGRYPPFDLGALHDSGHVAVALSGATATATVGFGGASAPYAVYVHEGTGPAVGRPPFSPPGGEDSLIAAWARRHGMTDAALGSQREGSEDTAWKLARSIGRFGLTPRKFLERAVSAARDGMDERIAADVFEQLGGVARAPRKIPLEAFQAIERPRGRPAPPRAPSAGSGRRVSVSAFKPVKKRRGAR